MHHNIAALDATNVMLNLNSFTGNLQIGLILGLSQSLLARFLLGLERDYLIGFVTWKARIFP